MSFPTYPAYKDSGVEWLGDVPEHWYSARFSRVVMAIKDGTHGTFERVDEGVPLLSAKNVQNGFLDINEGESLISEDDSRSIVSNGFPSAGDLLLTIVGTIGRSCVYTADKPYAFQRSVCFLRFYKRYSSYFFYYFSQSKFFQEQLAGRSKSSAQAGVYMGDVVATSVVFPPDFSEQTQIARFLDHETARIDALIEEQQRLIELLKEKRRGIVLSALSDTSLPLVRIGHAVDVISRPVKQREDESYTPIGLFNRDRGLFHKEPREMQDMGDSDFFWIKSGDLIISGQFAWEGAVAMAGESEEGLVVSHRYPVLRGKHGVANTEYLYAILTTKHGDFLLNESSRGAAGRNRPLNLAALLKEKIRIPSKEIQEQVSNLVQNEAKVLTECRQQISLLQERRSALISAAVTGKIDVRGWQPPASTQAPKLEVVEAN